MLRKTTAQITCTQKYKLKPDGFASALNNGWCLVPFSWAWLCHRLKNELIRRFILGFVCLQRNLCFLASGLMWDTDTVINWNHSRGRPCKRQEAVCTSSVAWQPNITTLHTARIKRSDWITVTEALDVWRNPECTEDMLRSNNSRLKWSEVVMDQCVRLHYTTILLHYYMY